ncbi:harmonin-like isoform X1 [Mytilus californianus]|uniref:harmonin-like isoform X1 n=1 Tax=Mytilus californianus TaxID=6549 RepID=UPI0022474558|nr:harmonin-like isoform X1 [Mytilus californianus]
MENSYEVLYQRNLIRYGNLDLRQIKMASTRNSNASEFSSKVNDLIPKPEERDAIFRSLEVYQQTLDLLQLVEEMMKYIDEPTKLELFEYLRPLIPPKHQVEYDKLAPPPAGQKLRVVNLRRRQNESLGFAVRGGFEHGIGVFVSQITPGSQADIQGLKVGDEIVRVNGFTIAEAIHEEVLNLIKTYNQIELKVTNIGMLPVRDKAEHDVTWRYVEKQASKRRSQRDSGRKSNSSLDKEGEEVKVFVNLRTAPTLGCSIISGPRHFPGIYVEVVKQNSLAEKVGMEAGDQIIKVNDTSFIDITHKEAVVALKSSKELIVILRKHVGIPLIQSGSSAMNRQMTRPASPPPPPVAEDDSSSLNDRSAVNDRIFDRDDIYNTETKMQVDNSSQNTDEVHVVSSYNLKSKEGRLPDQTDKDDMIQIVDIIEPEVSIENKDVPSDNEEDDTAERLQRVLQQKLDENKKEAELLRMQSGFVKTFSKLWQPKSLFKKHKKEDEILSGRGGPLKKTSYGLLGNPQGLQGSDRNNTSDVSTYF